MADITPTYDFGQNETPTMATLIEQALSLRVSGLTFSDFAAGVLSIFSGVDSGVTGEALVTGSPTAQMWVDSTGNIWVMEASGPVRLYRHQHGWESRRFWVEEDSGYGALSPAPPGVGVQCQGQAATEAFARAQEDTTQIAGGIVLEIVEQSLDDNQQGRYHGLTSETGDSGFVRWCGRGGHQFWHLDPTQSTTQVYDRGLQNNMRMLIAVGSPGPTTWQHVSFLADLSANNTRAQGIALAPMNAGSTVSDSLFSTNGYHNRAALYGWNFGIPKFANLEAGDTTP